MSSTNPVWDVYNLWRTARLNVKYYSARIETVESQHFWMDAIVAVTAPGSAIAGLAFIQTGAGQAIWSFFCVVAAIVAVIKPLLKIPKKLKAYEETLVGYKALDHDLQRISARIKTARAYTVELQELTVRAIERKAEIACKETESKENKKLKVRLTAEVNQELPVGSFYVPPYLSPPPSTGNTQDVTSQKETKQ